MDLIALLLPLAVILPLVGLWFGWANRSAASDGPRIKRDYEGPGRRVVRLERCGFAWGGRSSPSFRKYAVTVEAVGGRLDTRHVGVEVTVLGDPSVVEYP